MHKPKKLRALIKRAKMGNPASMYRLGIFRELDGDMNEALEWISASAALGYTPAEEWIKDYFFDDDVCIQANA